MRRISLLVFVTLSLLANGQETSVSPYSRFGIGDPDPGDFVSQFGMGGTGVAVIDGFHINPYNPAAQSFLFSPVFEIGLRTERLKVTSSSESSINSNSRLNHFAVGFPMWGSKWGASFGLNPYSTVGYNNTVEQYSSDLDTSYTVEYIGSGGLNRIYLDLSRKLVLSADTSKYKQDDVLSIGLGFNYLFGSGSSERNLIFPINTGYMSTRIEDAATLNDISGNAGFILRFFTDKKESVEDRFSSALNIGGQFSMDENLNAKKSRNVVSYVENLGGVEFIRDSITSFKDLKGVVTIPGTLSLGLSYELYALTKSRDRQRKLVIALDYKTSDWSALREDFGQEVEFTGMGTSRMQSIGLSYQPQIGIQKGSRGNLLRLATYRLGYRTGDSHLNIENQAITENGMSFGVSLPLLVIGRKETDTQFDFGISYGERGTTDDGLLKEEYVRIMFGFSFHPDNRFDRWFRKRKYD